MGAALERVYSLQEARLRESPAQPGFDVSDAGDVDGDGYADFAGDQMVPYPSLRSGTVGRICSLRNSFGESSVLVVASVRLPKVLQISTGFIQEVRLPYKVFRDYAYP